MNKKISVYNILCWLNFLILILLLYTYSNVGDNMYVNEHTILLNVVLIIITHIVLRNARSTANPLLLLLSFFIIIFYELRVVTLNYTEFSMVLNRADVYKDGINNTLLYVIVAYCVLSFSLVFNFERVKRCIPERQYVIRKRATTNILVLLYISLVLSALAAYHIPYIEQIVSIASTFFFNIFTMMALSVVAFVYIERVPRKTIIAFIVFCLLYILIFTIVGRRSSLFSVVTTLLMVCLLFGYTRIKAKYVISALFLVPIMMFIFVFATLARAMDAKNMDKQDQIELIKRSSDKFSTDDAKLFLSPIFDRIGYLDYTTEMVCNRDHLSHFLTPQNYFKSIVDNVLTPGFDVFGIPRISNVISKSYSHRNGSPVTKKEAAEDYKSDILTLFGEVYVVFGFILCFFVLAAIGAFIKNMYCRQQHIDSIRALWIQSLILGLFYNLIQSFGFDWVAIDIVSAIINFYIFKKIVLKRSVVPYSGRNAY